MKKKEWNRYQITKLKLSTNNKYGQILIYVIYFAEAKKEYKYVNSKNCLDTVYSRFKLEKFCIFYRIFWTIGNPVAIQHLAHQLEVLVSLVVCPYYQMGQFMPIQISENQEERMESIMKQTMQNQLSKQLLHFYLEWQFWLC